jgi:hypothetical protein
VTVLALMNANGIADPRPHLLWAGAGHPWRGPSGSRGHYQPVPAGGGPGADLGAVVRSALGGGLGGLPGHIHWRGRFPGCAAGFG